IVADGDAKEILTNKELTFKASIVPPQMTQIFVGLADFGLPMDVINVHEARRILLGFLKEEVKP
nr:hypothetical protein [Candidatus Bathyarchaeota archaeon]NIV43879.1 hypothetical protein [Candidatus Bathyarchaeota archaeon]